MNSFKNTCSIDRLRELFYYDAESGDLVWKKSPRRGVSVGKVAGGMTDNGYKTVGFDGIRPRSHRVIWAMLNGYWPSEIDHINGIRSDNRIENLREVTRSENNQNSFMRSDNKTGCKGVHFRKDTGKYSVTIQVQKKVKHVGCFSDFEQAKAARTKAENQLHPFKKTA